jgi:hypothetical protein
LTGLGERNFRLVTFAEITTKTRAAGRRAPTSDSEYQTAGSGQHGAAEPQDKHIQIAAPLDHSRTLITPEHRGFASLQRPREAEPD